MWALSKWLACGASSRKNWLSEEVFQNIRHIQTYNWTKYALCENSLRGGLQGQAMAFRSSFLKHFTHPNIQLDKLCALWKYSGWWASSRSNSFQEKFIRNILHIQTYNWTKNALCESTVDGGLQAEAMAFRRSFSKHHTHSHI